jgi:hypothetical protein
MIVCCIWEFTLASITYMSPHLSRDVIVVQEVERHLLNAGFDLFFSFLVISFTRGAFFIRSAGLQPTQKFWEKLNYISEQMFLLGLQTSAFFRVYC